MSAAKFTPGPWAINHAGSGRDGQFVYDEVYVYAPSCGVEDVAVAADIADPLTGKPSIANARVIAAAPDLLEALQQVSLMLGDFVVSGLAKPQTIALSRQVNNAIAKATGGAA